MAILQLPSRRGHVPSGGTTGQVVTKNSNDNWDYNWADPTGGGGGGSLTSFSAGNLSPLFTTSVATATTTPALSFTLSNAAAHTFLGNNTGSTGAPSYVQPAFSDLSGSATDAQIPNALTLTTISNLTSNGFVKTGSGTGALSVDTLSHQPAYTINVKDPPYNAAGDGVTDDTTAIQNAINDVWNAGGGTIYLPKGVYLVNGAFDGTTNSVLKIPYNVNTNIAKNISIVGEIGIMGTGNNAVASPYGTIIKSTKTGTGTRPAIIAANPWLAVPSVTDFNYTSTRIRDLVFRTYDNPSIDAVQMATVSGLFMDNVRIDTGVQTGSESQPTHGAVALWTPLVGNGALNSVSNIAIAGYDIGMVAGEHTHARNVMSSWCNVGFDFYGVNEGSEGQLQIFWCPIGIRFSGAHAVDLFVENERAGVGPWYAFVRDIDDVINNGNGIVRYHIVQASVGIVTTPIVTNGGANLRFVNLWNSLDQVAGSKWKFVDPTDQTKKLQFDLSGIATATTRTLTPQTGGNSTTVPAGGTINQVLAKNSNTDFDLKWATGGGGTPGGSDTQVQFNDLGAFGGDADFTWNKTTNALLLGASGSSIAVGAAVIDSNPLSVTTTSAGHGLAVGAVGATTNSPKMGLYDGSTEKSSIGLALSATHFSTIASAGDTVIRSMAGHLIFSNQNNTDISFTIGTAGADTERMRLNSGGLLSFLSGGVADVAIARNAAGVLEINNNTAGTFRDLKCDHVNAVTGFQINGAASSGKILIGNGTNFVASTPTYPNASATAGKVLVSDGTNFVASTPTYPNASTTSGYQIKSDGTNYVSYPSDIINSSTAAVSAGYATDTYLAGSSCVVAAGDFKAKGQYHCVFDMTKTAAGTAAPVINVRVGTAGTTGDAAVLTFTLGAGTAATDTAVFELFVTFRSVGSGTSAVVQGMLTVFHTAASAAGITSTADKSLTPFTLTTSSGFNSSTATTIGVSFNGGASFSGTNTIVQAQLTQP